MNLENEALQVASGSFYRVFHDAWMISSGAYWEMAWGKRKQQSRQYLCNVPVNTRYPDVRGSDTTPQFVGGKY